MRTMTDGHLSAAAPRRTFPTANSGTPIEFADDWFVVDLGSGHNPHPRADLLIDRHLADDSDRSGKALTRPHDKPLVIADGTQLPLRDRSVDFVICSHVLEHVPDPEGFCRELQRIAKAGYLETPSRLAELIRHAPNHRWFVSADTRPPRLTVRPAHPSHPLGAVGKLFFSLYFYGTRQVIDRDVYQFANGVPAPWHRAFALARLGLVTFWKRLPSLTYTRLTWEDSLSCEVRRG